MDAAGNWIFIIICSLLFISVFGFLIYLAIVNDKEAKKNSETVSEKTDIIDEFEKTELRAKIIDQYCSAHSVGRRVPKAVNSFVVVFECKNNETLTFNLPEEMYLALEIGMEGNLILSGDTFFAFEADDIKGE